jgi:ribose transport system permease protein
VTTLEIAHVPNAQAPGSRKKRGAIRSWVVRFPMLIVLAFVLIATTIVAPEFWQIGNLQNLLLQNIPLMIIAVGVTFVLIGGGFDLSVGAIYAAAAIFYLSLDQIVSAPVALILALLLGVGIGIVNGVIINLFHINAFIATLGTSSVITGLMTLYVGANVRYETTGPFAYFGRAEYFGWLPFGFVIGLAVFIVGAVVLARSTFGRSVYAVGGNREAARLNGLRVGLISGATFAIVGALAALAGVFSGSLLGSAQPNMVGTVTLDAIAIVIIGGTSMWGGEGAMWRTGVGLAIIAVVQNVFAIENYDPSLQLVFKGLILLLAVGADVYLRRTTRD